MVLRSGSAHASAMNCRVDQSPDISKIPDEFRTNTAAYFLFDDNDYYLTMLKHAKYFYFYCNILH